MAAGEGCFGIPLLVLQKKYVLGRLGFDHSFFLVLECSVYQSLSKSQLKFRFPNDTYLEVILIG